MSSIEIICQGCARRLRVPAEHAGKKARCPHCKMINDLPLSSSVGDAWLSGDSVGDAERGGAPAMLDSDDLTRGGSDATQAIQPAESWMLRNPDGQEYGPVGWAELSQWMQEGRVGIQSELRRTSETAWTPASVTFPALSQYASAAHATPAPKSQAVEAAFSHGPTHPGPENAYAPPQADVKTPLRLRPHRAGMLLTFSLIGMCCGVFSIVSLVLSTQDLSAMNAGQMDRSGFSMTRAAQVLAIIGLILFGLNMLDGDFVNVRIN